MIKRHTFLSLFLILSQTHPVFGQELIGKLKPAYQSYINDKGVANGRMKNLFAALRIKKAHTVKRKKNTKPSSVDGMVAIYLENPAYTSSILQSLRQSPYYEYVEQVSPGVNKPLFLPNDPFAQPETGTQYYLQKVNAYKAWDITKGDSNVVICFVDNGIDPSHPEIQGKIKYNHNDPIDSIDNDNDGFVDNYMGWDFANNDNFPEDTTGAYGHGTKVTGPAIALSDNALGIASIAQNCKFLPIKIFGDNGVNSYTQYLAVAYAAEFGCNVINLSWGSYATEENFYYQYEQDLLNYAALENDAVIVGATFPVEGRYFTKPGDYNNVLSVLALNPDDTKSYPQATHQGIDLSVPSIDFFTTSPHGQYETTSGISVGQPLVTGAAALVRSKYPWMNATQVQELLRVTARNIDTVKTNKNHKEKLGHGCLDIFKALSDTVTPAIRILEYEAKRIKDDTISLQLGFKNYLWPSKNLVLTFRTVSEGIEVVDSIAQVGVINKLDSGNTAFADIRLRILPHSPADSIAYIRIGMTDTSNHYTDYQYFYLNKNVTPPVITSSEDVTSEEFQPTTYPNPCEKTLFVEADGLIEMEVIDPSGKRIAHYPSPSTFTSINLEDVNSGIYFLRCRTASGVYSSKFLKK